jgi:hypothetical protein
MAAEAAAAPTIHSVADSNWRGSTHHITFEADAGQCYIDFRKLSAEEWKITAASFDGHGCMSTSFHSVPASLAGQFFSGVDGDGSSRVIEGEESAQGLTALRAFFDERVADVPTVWKSCLREYGLLSG